MTTMWITHTREYVNWLRMTLTDRQVAEKLGTTDNFISRVYWTRKKLDLPYLWEWKSRNRDKKEKFTSERILKTDKWEYNEVKQDWEWEIVQIGMWPAWFTRFNQNSLWKNS